jgi:hemerythrin
MQVHDLRSTPHGLEYFAHNEISNLLVLDAKAGITLMKVFLEWLDDWCLGLQEIDRQHLNLAELLNRVADSLDDTAEPSGAGEETMQLVMLLLEETRQHFRDEESVMRDHDYPELTDHCREHIMLLAELREFIREMEEGVRQFDLNALIALKHWLITHVIDSDLAFARYLGDG